MKIAAFIILYNEYLEDSLAYKSLLKLDIDVFLFDNSDQEQYFNSNSKYDEVESYNQNFGLSIIYNYLINKHKNNYDYILTSDSDSEYNIDFIEKFLEKQNDNNLVYIPYIYCKKKNQMMYPRNYINKHPRFFKLPNVATSNDNHQYYTSINTGTIYDTKVFNYLHFNENLAIDLIDYDIFDQLKKNKIPEFIFDSVVVQDFSGHDKLQSYTKGRIRFTFKDRLEYYGPIWYVYGLILYCGLTVHEKDFRYIKAYFNIHFLHRDISTLNATKLKQNFKDTIKKTDND